VSSRIFADTLLPASKDGVEIVALHQLGPAEPQNVRMYPALAQPPTQAIRARAGIVRCARRLDDDQAAVGLDLKP
jgi:hypothetical protein